MSTRRAWFCVVLRLSAPGGNRRRVVLSGIRESKFLIFCTQSIFGSQYCSVLCSQFVIEIEGQNVIPNPHIGFVLTSHLHAFACVIILLHIVGLCIETEKWDCHSMENNVIIKVLPKYFTWSCISGSLNVNIFAQIFSHRQPTVLRNRNCAGLKVLVPVWLSFWLTVLSGLFAG